jgi:hypothetical protein
MAPLFSSYYCKRECDRHSVVKVERLKRWDNQEVLLITEPSQRPAVYRYSIWIDPVGTSQWPRTVGEACMRQWEGSSWGGLGWAKFDYRRPDEVVAPYYNSGWRALILP